MFWRISSMRSSARLVVMNPGVERAVRVLAILVGPGFECFCGREHLDGQSDGGVGRFLAEPGVRPGPARVAAEEQTQRRPRRSRRCAMSSGAVCLTRAIGEKETQGGRR
jgi:hypothetical protein